MDKDINFALAILKKEYSDRRKTLVENDYDSRTKDNILADLERISASIFKIEKIFVE